MTQTPDGEYLTRSGAKAKASDIRYIKGDWRTFDEFVRCFGSDVWGDWDTATTLQEYLEGRHG